jgi:hypothetical protein
MPMRTFVNLFLVLFLADGALSVADELAVLLFAATPLSGLRSALASLVIIQGVAVYCCLGIDQRLPKRLLLPLILFVVCSPGLGWLLPQVARVPGGGALLAASQLALGLVLLFRLRAAGAPDLLLPPSRFAAPFFSRKNTLTFVLANLLVMPLFLALLLLFLANGYLAAYTAGFMRVTPRGLWMTERTYGRNGQAVRLASMIHVGQQAYYDDVTRAMATGRTIVLAEGVSDDADRLEGRLDYGRVADYLGLASQAQMRLRGRLIDAAQLEEPPPQPAQGGAVAEQADILRADLDVSDFRPETIRFLAAMGKQLQENPSLTTGLLSLNSWAEKNMTPAMQEIIIDDVLHQRNRVLLGHLEKALRRYDTVVIPWGALHMPEIEAAVLQRGFALRSEQERLSIDFVKLLLGSGGDARQPTEKGVVHQ